MCRGCRKVVKTGWQVVRPMDYIPLMKTKYIKYIDLRVFLDIHKNKRKMQIPNNSEKVLNKYFNQRERKYAL